jgi:hypothetical protein
MRKLLLLLVVLGLGVAATLVVQSGVAPINALPTQAQPSPEPYSPARYGLDDTIAGYKILAVFSSDTQACMPPGNKILVLQARQPDLETFQTAVGPAVTDITADLRRQGIADVENWTMDFVGPTANLERILQQNRQWNEEMARSGCVKLGGPIVVAATPAK